jgi:hypothetical protein
MKLDASDKARADIMANSFLAEAVIDLWQHVPR